jgi:hypothetical protein
MENANRNVEVLFLLWKCVDRNPAVCLRSRS